MYKIWCHNYDITYVGQTKHQLKTKVHKHIINVKKKSGSPVVTNRSLATNHDFKCNDLQISNNESSYNKRLISEMVRIRKHEFSKSQGITV